MTQADRQQTQLDLDKVFDALRGPLGLIDSPERRADIERFIDAARLHQERAIFDLLDRMASAINQAATNIRVSLEYREGGLNLAVESALEQEEPGPIFSGEDEVERVTIRMPARLKTLIDEEAKASGTSTNTWYVRTLARALSFRRIRERPFDGPPFMWPGRRGRGRRERGPSGAD